MRQDRRRELAEAVPEDIMNEPEQEYMAYLLRLWQVKCEGTTCWRVSLESPGSRQSLGFASLDDLILFLRQRTRMQRDSDDAHRRTR